MMSKHATTCAMDWGIDLNRLSHAYIIQGNVISQIHDAADYLAALILCEGEGQAPCGACGACILTNSSNNPDLIYINVPKDKKSIGADEARALINDVYIKPFRSNRKVYIIADADKLTVQAQNTLLKVLEEPPSYAVFIICVASPDIILDTIHSRSSHIRLSQEQSSKLSDYIANTYPSYAYCSDFISSYSCGVTQCAVELCESGVLELRRQMLLLLSKVVERRASDLFLVSEFFASDDAKKHIPLLLEFAHMYFRDALTLSVTGGTKFIINTDFKDNIVDICSRLTKKTLADIMNACDRARQMANRYVNNKALILNMLIKIWENGDY